MKTLIKKRWPLWIKLIVAPIAFAGAMVSTPVIVLFAFADFYKAEAILNFWTEQE